MLHTGMSGYHEVVFETWLFEISFEILLFDMSFEILLFEVEMTQISNGWPCT